MKLAGQVAVITGAGSGLGRESALLFAREGAKVVVMDVRGDRAGETAKLVTEDGGTAVAVEGDVSVEAAVARTVETAIEEFGTLDIMFANAGIVSRGGVPTSLGGEAVEFQDLPIEDWHKVVAVNLTGVFLSCKHAVPPMRRNGGGTIVVTSSAAAFVAFPNVAAYSATTAGVNGMVRALSFDLGKYGIRINALCPFFGMSPNFLMPPDADVVAPSYYDEVARSWDSRVSPLPLRLDRPPTLADNAKVALFLASDDSTYMSGVCLPSSDGGSLAKVAMHFGEDLPPA
jgi:NAD(P)-dependent dehydrogenase (short-subunit alcohol dehydrogenase family)